MSSLPQSTPEQPLSAPARNANVVMGPQNYISILLRAIGGELYKIRRRAMSKILTSIALVLMILGFIVFLLPTFVVNPQAAASSLRFSQTLNTAAIIANSIGIVLLVILTGTIVGEEYTVGSIRLMLIRGTTRTQFLLAKMGTALVCVFIFLIPLLIIGIITEVVLGGTTGVSSNFSFLTGAYILHAILYILAIALGLFTYCLLAISLATLGKATAAGVTGAFIWWFIEGVASNLLPAIGSFNKGPFGNFLQAIPDFFIGNNLVALQNNQYNYMTNTTGSGSISDLHAILVIIVYLAIFIGVTGWVHKTRDVTN